MQRETERWPINTQCKSRPEGAPGSCVVANRGRVAAVLVAPHFALTLYINMRGKVASDMREGANTALVQEHAREFLLLRHRRRRVRAIQQGGSRR